MELKDFFEKHRRVALAFSGGVDSSYLLYAAQKYADKVRAYYVKSVFQPTFEYEDALRLAGQLKADLCVITIDVLADDKVTSNPSDRCYYCKQRIFSKILEQAKSDGFTDLLDGTNASDSSDDRPGMKALKEMKVLSPLRECGLTKARIRELSKEAGLFTWNKPAYACLATRIPSGTQITAQKLEKTERAEAFLMSLGFKDFRVRMMEAKAPKENLNGQESKNSSPLPIAKLELSSAELPLLVENRQQIISKLKIDYDKILLDLELRDN